MPYPHDHDEWKKKRKEISEKRKSKKNKNGNDDGSLPLPRNSSGQKLTLSKNLRNVLFTNCGMSDKQITDMVDAYDVYDQKNKYARTHRNPYQCGIGYGSGLSS
eukprot:3745005-Ditylum_brightwellii.AAC.1